MKCKLIYRKKPPRYCQLLFWYLKSKDILGVNLISSQIQFLFSADNKQTKDEIIRRTAIIVMSNNPKQELNS